GQLNSAVHTHLSLNVSFNIFTKVSTIRRNSIANHEVVWLSMLMMRSGILLYTKKGLRQGDPHSPLIFNIVADILPILVKRAKNVGQISEKARNMKLLLWAFEQVSGLKLICIRVNIVLLKSMRHWDIIWRSFDVGKETFL
ncbi:hypothetical protein U9M48_004391, partial [Paspalum notatum var. saurae]